MGTDEGGGVSLRVNLAPVFVGCAVWEKALVTKHNSEHAVTQPVGLDLVWILTCTADCLVWVNAANGGAISAQRASGGGLLV